MSDQTYKNVFDDGYTTYHDDGSKSVSYKNVFDDGYTTYHDDGSKSQTYQNVFDDGTTTYHSDGSKSTTYSNVFDDGYTTYHSDGSKSTTYGNVFDNGYTTYHTPGPSSSYGQTSSGSYACGGSYGYGGLSFIHRATAGEIIILILCCLLAGAAVWWYTTEMPIVPLTCLAVVLIAGVIQRRKNDITRQSIWYVWSLTMTTLTGFYMVQHKAAGPSEILQQIAFFLMPLAFILIMLFVSRYATDDSNDGFLAGFCAILVILSWILTIYRNYGNTGYTQLFMLVQDVLFILVLLMAFINLIRALFDCRISFFAFFMAAGCTYLLARELTDFYGFHLLGGLIGSLIGRLISSIG